MHALDENGDDDDDANFEGNTFVGVMPRASIAFDPPDDRRFRDNTVDDWVTYRGLHEAYPDDTVRFADSRDNSLARWDLDDDDADDSEPSDDNTG